MHIRLRPAAVPALIALAYFAGGAVLYALGLSSLTGGDGVLAAGAGASWPRLAVLAGVCAPILLRCTHPTAALVAATVPMVIDALMGTSLPAWLAYGDLLYCAVLSGSPRVRESLERGGVLVVGAAAVWAAVALGDLAAGVLVAGVGTLLVLTPVWWAGSLRRQRETAAAEHARAESERARAESEQARAAAESARAEAESARSSALARMAEMDRDAAVSDERRRLARELHDAVAGYLSAIAIQSEAALRMRGADPDRALTVLDAVRANSVDALEEMQAMIGLLRGGADETAAAGRLADLDSLTASARAAGTEVRTDLPAAEHLRGLDPGVDLAAYRIVQEALTNATKHAPGTPVRLRLAVDGACLTIECRNPLAGAAAARESPDRGVTGAAGRGSSGWGSSGWGVGNIAERAHAVGGRADAGRSGGCWEVRARLPLTRDGVP